MLIKKLNLKSQSAMEFVLLATFMLMVMLGFFAVTSSRFLEAKEEGNKKIAEDIANFAYREIEIAKSVNDGYIRTFSMPQSVNGVNYTISVIDNKEIVVDYLGYEYVKFLPANVTGSISKGINEIKKDTGVIYLTYVQPVCGNNICEGSESCSSCSSDCGACPSLRLLLMKNSIFNVLYVGNDGNAILKGTLQQNSNPQPTADDEFVFRDSSGNNAAIVNLITGNMIIKGTLFQNQQTLTPSAQSNDFVVKDTNGNAISYIDESGNFYLKGALTQNGNP